VTTGAVRYGDDDDDDDEERGLFMARFQISIYFR